MYLQIIDQISHKVAVGDWPADTELPSIRQLATDLGVSVITIKRAYLELERLGVIVTQHGRGSFVAPAQGLSTALWEQQLARSFEEAARLGRMLGLGPAALKDRLDAAIKHEKDD